jgi:hypothetical protein
VKHQSPSPNDEIENMHFDVYKITYQNAMVVLDCPALASRNGVRSRVEIRDGFADMKHKAVGTLLSIPVLWNSCEQLNERVDEVD